MSLPGVETLGVETGKGWNCPYQVDSRVGTHKGRNLGVENGLGRNCRVRRAADFLPVVEVMWRAVDVNPQP